MEQIALPFLNFMRISPGHRSSMAQTRALIGQLLCKLEGFSVDSERDPKRERAAAENLVKCLYHERMMLCELEAREYVKIVRFLWEFEDQGYIASSRCSATFYKWPQCQTYKHVGCMGTCDCGEHWEVINEDGSC